MGGGKNHDGASRPGSQMIQIYKLEEIRPKDFRTDGKQQIGNMRYRVDFDCQFSSIAHAH